LGNFGFKRGTWVWFFPRGSQRLGWLGKKFLGFGLEIGLVLIPFFWVIGLNGVGKAQIFGWLEGVNLNSPKKAPN